MYFRSFRRIEKKMIIFAFMKRILPILLVLIAACSRPETTLFVGTYSDGFYALDFASSEVIAKAPMPNPSFLALRDNKVYAVSEMPDVSASVWAWRYGGNGFEFLGSQPTGLPEQGEDPCYVATNGHLLAVANYSGGTLALYNLKGDGSIGPLDSLVVSGIGGPDLSRQETPHVHCATFTPDGKHLFFSEFSADAIGSLDIAGRISNYRIAATLPADFGPRHLLFDASGKHFYVIGELSGDIAVFDYDSGRLSLKQVIKADKVDARGAADIHLSPDGKFLYASLRLQNDGIAIFSVAQNGTLAEVGYQHTGPHPRNFAITKDLAIVACRDSDEIEIYHRDAATGLLKDSGRRIRLPKPVFVSLQQ
jgi:6-phosphogluconolactonase (cycloisomerase 2 family)